jgi:hypothetical protein
MTDCMSMALIEAPAAFMSSLIGIALDICIGIAGTAGELISIGATALAAGRGDGCRLLAGGVGDAGPLVIPGVGPIVISGIGDELDGGAKAARALPEKRAVAAAIVTKASGKRSNRTAAFRSIYYG